MQVSHLTKSFGGRTLFSDVTFKLEDHDRLALVGPNGAGKTTMLRIITGQEDADGGEVFFARGARVGYLEQEAIEMPDRPIFEEVMSSQVEILEAEQRLRELEESLGDNPTERQLAAAGRARDAYEMLGGYTIEAKVRGVLFGLGFKEGDIKQATTNFSGGWQMRIALAKLLVRNPEVLMLDEPTNHLDLESVKWLEGFLRGYEGTVIVGSHDRVFMDRVGTHVLYLGLSRPVFRKATYTQFLSLQEEYNAQREREAKALQDELARKMAFVERFRAKATKARQAQDRIKKLDKLMAAAPNIGLSCQPSRCIHAPAASGIPITL